MKPRLLNLAAAVSLLLAVAIIVLWVRSYGRHEAITRNWHTPTAQCSWNVESRYSSLRFMITRIPDTGPPIAPTYEYWNWTQLDRMDPRALHWFPLPPVEFQHLTPGKWPVDQRELEVAYWLLLPPTLILPTIAFVGHRRQRRREADNLCPTCGYDLRAHNAGDRCPECGMVSASSAGRIARTSAT